jgi:hypothetical protein
MPVTGTRQTTVNSIVDTAQDREQARQDREIENYTLVGNGGWPNLGLVLISLLLGYWNFRLFIDTIPGIDGIITGLVALSCEATAWWCVHNYSRSTGQHQKTMKVVAIGLGLFSLSHATMSVIHRNAYGLTGIIDFYSHVVAFPLLLVLLTLSLVALKMNHWSVPIASQLGQMRTTGLINRANVLVQQARMRSEHGLARLRAALFQQKTQLEADLLPIAQQFIATRQQRESMLAQVQDPNLRRQLMSDMSELFNGEDDQPPQLQSGPPAVSPLRVAGRP